MIQKWKGTVTVARQKLSVNLSTWNLSIWTVIGNLPSLARWSVSYVRSYPGCQVVTFRINITILFPAGAFQSCVAFIRLMCRWWGHSGRAGYRGKGEVSIDSLRCSHMHTQLGAFHPSPTRFQNPNELGWRKKCHSRVSCAICKCERGVRNSSCLPTQAYCKNPTWPVFHCDSRTSHVVK